MNQEFNDYQKTLAQISQFSERMLREQARRITPVQKIDRVPFNRPPFSLSMTERLYEDAWEFSPDFVEEYLQSDKDALISDLEIVLKDSYSNFSATNIEYSQAAFHAYFMLGELHATKSLSYLLEVLSQEKEYFEYIFSDYLTEVCWQSIFQLGKDNITDLFSYLKKPGLYTYGKSVVIDAIPQLYITYPELQAQIIEEYADLLNVFIQSDIEDNIIDSDLIGLLLIDFLDLKLAQFIPQIKELFEKGYVFDNHAGNFDKVKEELLKNDEREARERAVLTVNEIYESIRDNVKRWEEKERIAYESRMSATVFKKEKIGRNDPCPCGSGKKYKKCCLGKGVYEG